MADASIASLFISPFAASTSFTTSKTFTAAAEEDAALLCLFTKIGTGGRAIWTEFETHEIALEIVKIRL